MAINQVPISPAGPGLASPATDFYFVETPGPAGKLIVTGVQCSLCQEEFSDTRIGARVTSSCVDKAIEHSRLAHQVSRIAFRLGKAARKPKAHGACL
jgi:hypothetical protein